MKVHIRPTAEESDAGTGIGQVVLAQYKHLPAFGIEITPDPARADVIAVHTQDFGLPRIDALHCHGLYWTGDPGSGRYHNWHHEANRRIAAAARKARIVTVPSGWVGEPFRRDMRITPAVIGHGIDLDAWTVSTETGGYVLWNKNRAADVCDPTPALELARRGAKVVSTFAPDGAPRPQSLIVTGRLPFDEMKPLIQGAGVYLATTKETFGIGTLEALAAGIPVLGYRWGGTDDLVVHRDNGYLVEPGDIDGLFLGLGYIQKHRARLSANARRMAGDYAWRHVIADYARLYRILAANPEPGEAAVVIPCYNYGRYLAGAVESVAGQADEVIIVDDGSTDETPDIGRNLAAQYPNVRYVRQANRGVAAARNNGIALAGAPFIVCLDADDRLDPHYIQTCRAAMLADRGLGIAYTGLSILRDDGPEPYGAWPPAFDWRIQSRPSIPPGNCIPSAAMFRRSLWERAGGFRQVYAPGEDAEFWTRGLAAGFTARKVTEKGLFWYRLHDGSASRTRPYRRVDAWLPWMRDGQYPFAAPDQWPVLVRSYDPVVSVIIPVGPGHEHYLPAAIESLLGQTFRAWEVIVVDDTGADVDWLAALALRYPFMRTVWPHMQVSYGAGRARNAGLDRARGPLVLFLDADDYLLPDALRQLVGKFCASDGHYVYGDWIVAGETDVRATPEFSPALLAAMAPPVTVLMLTEHARQIRFDETLPTLEEWDFFGRAAEAGILGVRLDAPVLVYRLDSGTRREDPRKDETAANLRERFAHLTEENDMACGGCGSDPVNQAIIAAKRALTQPVSGQSLVESKPGWVRMAYTGNRVGSVTYFGLDKRRYRFGNNAVDRYQDVHPDDVKRLAGTGEIVVVAREEPPAQFPPEPVEELPAPEPGLPELEYIEAEPAIADTLDPGDYTVKAFTALLAATDTEKWAAPALVEMLKREQAGANRKGVTGAIEALLNA